MPFEVDTKDCTSLSDAELAEMGDLCSERDPQFEVGFLSKQREEWVLITHVREGKKLRGYSFCTLERIGGTPSLLVGWHRSTAPPRPTAVLRHLMADQYRRALLAFPDEDVLVGTRIAAAGGILGVLRAVRRGAEAGAQGFGRGESVGAGGSPSASVPSPASTTGPSCSPGTASTTGALDHGGPKVSEPADRSGGAAGGDGQRHAETASSCSAGRWPRTWHPERSPGAGTVTERSGARPLGDP